MELWQNNIHFYEYSAKLQSMESDITSVLEVGQSVGMDVSTTVLKDYLNVHHIPFLIVLMFNYLLRLQEMMRNLVMMLC